MKSKNIIPVVLMVVIVLLGISIFAVRKGTQVPASNVPVLNHQIEDSNKPVPNELTKDVVLVNRKGKVYEIDIKTKELKAYVSPENDIITFAGLPKETKNKQFSVYLNRTLLSQDKTKAIVVFTTFDETKEPSGFDGSLPVLKADEFICTIATKNCVPTDILKTAFETIFKAPTLMGKWYQSGVLWWRKWDSVSNVLYGHLTGEGVGNSAPVYIYHKNENTVQRTLGYNSLDEKEKRAGVPMGSFSPSLDKFVMIEESGSIWNLLLYKSNNPSTPFKKYDVSATKFETYQRPIDSVAWSADEKFLILLGDKRIFILNLDNGKISLVHTDTDESQSGLWLDFNGVALSPSERYIVFVEYGNNKMEDGGMDTILKAIDLGDHNEIIELLHEELLSLFDLPGN